MDEDNHGELMVKSKVLYKETNKPMLEIDLEKSRLSWAILKRRQIQPSTKHKEVMVAWKKLHQILKIAKLLNGEEE